jgi:SAM-dependent methyltransferase
MERAIYDWMNIAEESMWWYHALHSNMLNALDRHPGPSSMPLLDAGCGTGQFLCKVAAAHPKCALFGLEVDEAAACIARTKSPAHIVVGSVNDLPFADGSFGTICSLDVLYHKLVDPAVALRQAMRCLAPGGVIAVNLPAYQWLYSFHDREDHGARRFTLTSARRLLAGVGCAEVYATYWNTLLFPFMVLQRKFAKQDTTKFPGFLNAILKAVTSAERVPMRAGLRYPFGGSVLIVGRKPVSARHGVLYGK